MMSHNSLPHCSAAANEHGLLPYYNGLFYDWKLYDLNKIMKASDHRNIKQTSNVLTVAILLANGCH
jgi:hypothetical protein